MKIKREEKSEEEEEEEDDDISLDSLLKRSREYVKKEQSQQGSKVVHTKVVTQTNLPETVSAKDVKNCSQMQDTCVQFGFSLHHSPVGPPQAQIESQTLHESGCVLSSVPDCYARLPPQSSTSPRVHKRKPRPVSTGNIHIAFPIGSADLILRSPGRSGEVCDMSDWGKALTGVTKSSNHWGSMGNDSGVGVSRSDNRQSSHCATTPGQEASPVNALVPSPVGHHDHLATEFRRRCHTLDSQMHSYHSGAEQINHSQERVPRFMAGVTWLAPNRRAPAVPSNQSYEVESPSSVLRPSVTCDSTKFTVMTGHDDSQGSKNGRMTPTVLRNASDVQMKKTGESVLISSLYTYCIFFKED